MKHYIIPMFIPHYGCPHQCVFCDQRKITGVEKLITGADVAAIIEQHLAGITKPYIIEVAFYGGSFTALPVKQQVDLLTPALTAKNLGNIHRIRVSTRPDAISEETNERLTKFGVWTVELGVQSLDNKVLAAAGRGHTVGDVVKAVELLKNYGINVGLQLMPGLPGENWASLLKTGVDAKNLRPNFVRIYPTVVIENTPLATMYRTGKYQPLSLAEAVARAAYLKLLFSSADIPVIRTGLQSSEELSTEGVVLAGPYHPAFGEMVDAFMFQQMFTRFVEEVRPDRLAKVLIHHHNQDHSKLRGVKNTNLNIWKDKYNFSDLALIADWPRRDEIAVDYHQQRFVINKQMLF
jgi:histone acetyltransferase (RNA polymerase elongator complex component)